MAQGALCKRLARFGLVLEPSKTRLVEFGRFAERHAPKRGRKRPETIYFLGFALDFPRNQQGNYMVGRPDREVSQSRQPDPFTCSFLVLPDDESERCLRYNVIDVMR